MFDKHELAKEIGNFFGTYFEQDGKFCIDNDDKIFHYDTLDALLEDWVDTLVENHHDMVDEGDRTSCRGTSVDKFFLTDDSWEREILFIYEHVIGKYPDGVRPVENKTKGITWKSSVDVKAPGHPHGKNLHLGTYSSIVDAIYARMEFVERMERNPLKPIDFWVGEAKQMQVNVKAKESSKSIADNLIRAMVAYGEDSCWTDREVFEALYDCGLSYYDFQRAGYEDLARNYFLEESAPSEIVFYSAETDARELNSLSWECDPYLFTCCADNGFVFLVRGIDEADAEKCGMRWYEENVFEPGKFKCWKTDQDDLDNLNRNEILESHAYVSMVHESSNSKKPLSQQILNAEGKASQQNSLNSFDKEPHR